MTETPEKIKIDIKYKELEKTITGTPEEVWLWLNKLFADFIPSFKIAKKLWLDIDLQKLAEECIDLIAFSKEGLNLLIPKSKITDNETLLLWLLATQLGYRLGAINKSGLSKEELQARLGKSGKITSTRLGELVKNDLVTKTEDGYELTTFGMSQMSKEILQKIRAKTLS